MKKGKKGVNSINALKNKKNSTSSDKLYNEFKKIYDSQFLITFTDILNLTKKDFFNTISTKSKILINEKCKAIETFTNEKLKTTLDSFSKEYESRYNNYKEEINEYLNNYKNSNRRYKDNYIGNFRKHCWKTDKYAVHNCDQKNKRGHFLPIYCNNSRTNNNNSINNKSGVRQRKTGTQNNKKIIDKKDKEIKELKYLFCPECKKVFFINKFLNYCIHCKIEYYSKIIDDNESNLELLPAMWENNHCKISNESIKCPLCYGIFFLDIKFNILKCLKCKYYKSPKNIERICNTCLMKYTSNIFIYNPLEKQFLTEIINNSIINKQLARPKNVPCCQNINNNINSIEFYHNNNCKGILLIAEYHQKSIIFCIKCKEIFIYSRYTWTCPSCGIKFIDGKINDMSKNILYSKSTLDIKDLRDSRKMNYNQNSTNAKNYELIKKNIIKYDKNTANNAQSNIIKEMKKNINITNNTKNTNNKNNKDIHVNIKIFNRNNNQKENDSVKIKTSSSIEMYNIKRKTQRDLTKNQEGKEKIIKKNVHKSIDDKKDIYYNKSEAFLFNKILSNNKGVIKTPINIMQNYRKNIPLNHSVRIKSDSKNSIKMSINEEQYKNKSINKQNHNNYINANKILFKRSVGLNNNKNDNIINKKKNNILIISQDSIEEESDNNIVTNNNNNNKFLNLKNLSSVYIPSQSLLDESNMKFYNFSKNKNDEKFLSSSLKNHIYRTELNSPATEKIISFQNKSPILKRNKNNCFIIKKNRNESKESIESNKNIKNIKIIENEKSKKETSYDTYSMNTHLYPQENNVRKIVSLSPYTPKILGRWESMEKNNSDSVKLKKDYKKMDTSNSVTEIKAIKKYEKSLTKNEEQNNKNKAKVIQKDKLKDNNSNKQLIKVIEFAKKEIMDNKPSDIIEHRKINYERDIIIEDPYLKSHPDLYDKIHKNLKQLVRRSHLPLFNPDLYTIEKKIGEGTNGSIFQVVSMDNNKKYAMKKLIANNLIALKYLIKEFDLIYDVFHPNILNIYAMNIKCFDTSNYSLCVLMEIGITDWDVEISEHLESHQYYTEEELISILKQLTSALLYLQKEKKIAHRDVKPENVVIFKNNIYKIGDFGEAKGTIKDNNNKTNTLRGTDIYMSPILYKSLQLSQEDVVHNMYKSDVFSLGYSFLYAVALNHDIINEIRDLDDSEEIKKVLFKMMKPRYSDTFINVILKMINLDEKKRIDFIGLDKLIKEVF